MSTPRNSRWWPAPTAAGQPADMVTPGRRRPDAKTRNDSHTTLPGDDPLSAVRTLGILTSGDTQIAEPDERLDLALWWAAAPGVTPAQRAAFSQIAHRLAQLQHAPFAPVALAAARLRAEVLDEQGDHRQAAQLWGRLIAVYQLAGKPVPEQHARLAHAVDLHRAGQCGEALNQINHAWQLCCDRPGHQYPTAVMVLRLHLAMLTACGQNSDREALLAEATTLPAIQRGDTACESIWTGVTVETPDVHQPVCAMQPDTEGEDQP
jgi:hypothetical protein